MIEVIVQEKDGGQRLDKYLKRILPLAPQNLLYKQLRNKNITLNGKRALGKELLQKNDSIRIFFSEDTFNKFSKADLKEDSCNGSSKEYLNKCIDFYKSIDIEVLFENDDIIAFNKPAGIKSQRDKDDFSMNEYLIGYCMSGKITEADYKMHHPSLQNRLDRNTSGIVLCSVTTRGAIMLDNLIKNHRLEKYYSTCVYGSLNDSIMMEDYWKSNGEIVEISSKPQTGFVPVKAQACPISYFQINGRPATLVNVRLYTGRKHQIRAQLSHRGYPVAGDVKYGIDKKSKGQLLHCRKIIFPSLVKECPELNNLVIECKEPDLWQHGIQGD